MLQAGLDSMRQTIREQEPIRPSTRLSTLEGAERTSVAKRRGGADVSKLAAALRGDVDWIVMKCLEKDRRRRYDTANGLALDLQRHLSNETVAARPPTATYLFSKLIRRNKLAVTAGAAISASLVIGIAVSVWQAVRADREAKRAKAAESQAVATLDELRAYAARVAATVGAMMTVLMGVRDPDTLARACDLGVAMQLTNIARDVGEDARMGRLYLPRAWLHEAGLDPDAWLQAPRFSAPLAEVVLRLLAAADTLYRQVDAGVARLPLACRPGINAARFLYADIGHEVLRRGGDSVRQRAVVPRRLGCQTQASADVYNAGVLRREGVLREVVSAAEIERAKSTPPASTGIVRNPHPLRIRGSAGSLWQPQWQACHSWICLRASPCSTVRSRARLRRPGCHRISDDGLLNSLQASVGSKKSQWPAGFESKCPFHPPRHGGSFR